MKTKFLLYTFVFALLCSCGAKSEYEQEARERAVVAAKALIETERDNIMKLEEKILSAKAVCSEYLLMGDTIASRAFDEAFKEYVLANDSVLAQEIFK